MTMIMMMMMMMITATAAAAVVAGAEAVMTIMTDVEQHNTLILLQSHYDRLSVEHRQ